MGTTFFGISHLKNSKTKWNGGDHLILEHKRIRFGVSKQAKFLHKYPKQTIFWRLVDFQTEHGLFTSETTDSQLGFQTLNSHNSHRESSKANHIFGFFSFVADSWQLSKDYAGIQRGFYGIPQLSHSDFNSYFDNRLATKFSQHICTGKQSYHFLWFHSNIDFLHFNFSTFALQFLDFCTSISHLHSRESNGDRDICD
jgi:hypothetical protein